MRVGIMSFAHMHAHAYAKHLGDHPYAALTAVWDDDVVRGQQAADAFGAAYFQNTSDFFRAGLDAVIVCSENSNHCDHVIKAAEASLPILCEKPIATEIADAQKMITACREHGVILQIAFPMRFSPSVQRAKEVIQSGRLGTIIAIKGTNHGQMPGGWFIEKERSGGGAAVDHIVHVMDLIRFMLQEEVKNVYAELDTRFYEIDVEDCGMVSLELASGAIVTIDPSWSRPNTFPMWGDVTMEIVGTKGTLSLDAFKQSSILYNDREGKIQQLPWAEDTDRGLIDDFVRSVKNNEKIPSITGEDGLRTLEVVKAVYKSNCTKSVVTL